MPRPLSLHQSMDFLHTWSGVLLGALLFLIFFMGTLSVFDREIDRWMLPETRLPEPTSVISFDHRLLPALKAHSPPNSPAWYASYPDARTAVAYIGWSAGGPDDFAERRIDPRSGRVLAEEGSWGGSGFFYPFHYSLHLQWMDIGIWIVGFAAMAMLTALVSGVIVHRRIFADFFTLRAKGSAQRAFLDLHNVTSVLLLPFHFVVTLSGLIIFYAIYMQAGIHLLYRGDADRYEDEAHGHVERPRAGHAAPLASVDAMIEEARRRWGRGEVRYVYVDNPGDRAAVISIGRNPSDRVSMREDAIYFDGASGRVLAVEKQTAVRATQSFISGLHMIPFEHWWLRWMYFAMGLMSSVMIATGLLLWINKRATRQAGLPGWRAVDATSCAGTLGVLGATATMLCFNRLLPPDLAHRPVVEASTFFVAWIACVAHAWLRGGPAQRWRAWIEQTSIVAALTFCAPLLNWITTGDHPIRSVARGDWAVASMDLVLLATSVVAAIAAGGLNRRSSATLIARPAA